MYNPLPSFSIGALGEQRRKYKKKNYTWTLHLIELEHLSAASNGDHLGLRHRKRLFFPLLEHLEQMWFLFCFKVQSKCPAVWDGVGCEIRDVRLHLSWYTLDDGCQVMREERKRWKPGGTEGRKTAGHLCASPSVVYICKQRVAAPQGSSLICSLRDVHSEPSTCWTRHPTQPLILICGNENMEAGCSDVGMDEAEDGAQGLSRPEMQKGWSRSNPPFVWGAQLVELGSRGGVEAARQIKKFIIREWTQQDFYTDFFTFTQQTNGFIS